MTDPSAPEDRFIGKLISDRYRIKRKIGEGGMGTVYEAVHEAIEKRIALKILHAQYSASPEVVHRFKQEAISASRIKHQNVIDIFDFGQLGDGSCFIAMEFLEGMDLGDALQARRRFEPEEAIRITAQLCAALGLGHGRGVVHRDLKPENVFLQANEDGDEIVKIVDFGIAQLRGKDDPTEQEARPRRLTKTGMIFGTPEYMAPEQARGADIDQRSDIYATGVILYELLSGAVPFLGESFLEVLNQHIQSRVPPLKEVNPELDLSPELERAVMRALEKDPDDRFPTMKEFSLTLLRTPEGRVARSRISSLTSSPDDDLVEARIENSTYPKPVAGGGTAMFGSAGQAAELPDDLVPHIPETSTRGLTAVVVLALIGALGAGAFFFTRRTRPAPQVQPPPPAAENELEPPPPAEEKDVSPEEVPPEVPAPAFVTLHVVTDPQGAVVKKDGFQVCSGDPCEVSVEPGAAVTLTAEAGSARGEAKVLAQKDQEVRIALETPRVVAPRPRPAPAAPPQPSLCEVMVDGIKILRPCE